MTSNVLDQAIVVGAGPAGLTAAIALVRGGVRVAVIERSTRLGELGAGLQITPNGSAVLAQLGLAGRLGEIGAKASWVEVRDYLTGKLLFRFELSRYCRAANSPYLLVHRADLIELLAETANGLGVAFHLGANVKRVSLGDESVECKFGDGKTLSSSFLVGADGIRSVTREALNGTSGVVPARYRAWRALFPSDNLKDMSPGTVRVYVGPRCHIVTYWLRNRSLLNLVAVEETRIESAAGSVRRGTTEELAQAFGDACNSLASVMEEGESVSVWALSNGCLARRSIGKGAALIGDALHPILPTLAQGANLAFEDAWVLAREVRRQGSMADALHAFRDERRKRLAKVLRYTELQVKLDHLAFPPTRHAAHIMLRLAGRTVPSVFASRYDWLFGKNVTTD